MMPSLLIFGALCCWVRCHYITLSYRLTRERDHIASGWLLLGLGLFPLVLVLFVGIEVNGSRAWLPIPGTSLRFQPSELAKIVLILAAARHFPAPAGGFSRKRSSRSRLSPAKRSPPLPSRVVAVSWTRSA